MSGTKRGPPWFSAAPPPSGGNPFLSDDALPPPPPAVRVALTESVQPASGGAGAWASAAPPPFVFDEDSAAADRRRSTPRDVGLTLPQLGSEAERLRALLHREKEVQRREDAVRCLQNAAAAAASKGRAHARKAPRVHRRGGDSLRDASASLSTPSAAWQVARRELAVAHELRLARRNNFPSCYPLAFHDIDADIPPPNQRMVRVAYAAWLLAATGYTWNWLVILLAFVAVRATACVHGRSHRRRRCDARWHAATPQGRHSSISDFFLATTVGAVGLPSSWMFWYKGIYNAAQTHAGLVAYTRFALHMIPHLLLCIWIVVALPRIGAFAAGAVKMVALFGDRNAFSAVLGIFCVVNIALWSLSFFLSLGVLARRRAAAAAACVSRALQLPTPPASSPGACCVPRAADGAGQVPRGRRLCGGETAARRGDNVAAGGVTRARTSRLASTPVQAAAHLRQRQPHLRQHLLRVPAPRHVHPVVRVAAPHRDVVVAVAPEALRQLNHAAVLRQPERVRERRAVRAHQQVRLSNLAELLERHQRAAATTPRAARPRQPTQRRARRSARVRAARARNLPTGP